MPSLSALNHVSLLRPVTASILTPKAGIEKESASSGKELAGLGRVLANEGFISRAAPAVVEGKRARAAELADALEALKGQLADFS